MVVDAATLIVRARRHAGITQAQLAARAGTSQPVISAYERGHRDPTVSTLRRLLLAAGTRLELGTSRLAIPDPAPVRPARDEQRAASLVDVLLLADAIPTRPRATPAFPRISSR